MVSEMFDITNSPDGTQGQYGMLLIFLIDLVLIILSSFTICNFSLFTCFLLLVLPVR